MSAPSLPPPRLPFQHRFNGSSGSLPDLPSPLSQVEWPSDTNIGTARSSTSRQSTDKDSGPGSLSGHSSRSTSGQPRWQHVKSEQEMYINVLEQRLAELKNQRASRTSSRRSSASPSHLSHLAFVGDGGAGHGSSDDGSADEVEEGSTDGDTEESGSDVERPLLGPSSIASVSRRASGDLPPQPVAIGGRIAFAPVVRIAAGIRSLAGSYTPYSGAPSRSTSPASSIYAPLLPAPGIAPGSAIKQAAKYGTITPPAQILGRQHTLPDGSTASSPYKNLAQAQRQRKQRRRRRKKWLRIKRRVLAGLAWFFCCGCFGGGTEAGTGRGRREHGSNS